MNKTELLKEILRKGPTTAAEVGRRGIPTSLLTRLVREGFARRTNRGLYVSEESGYTEMADYLALAAMVPNGVFTLLSALRLHELTDENPYRLSMMLRQGDHAPRIRTPEVQFFYRKEPQFSAEIETRNDSDIVVRVYSLEQTIADLFQYRNKIGLDVAIAALREAARDNRIDWNKLWQAAERTRMTRVMKPYIESVI